MKSRGSLTEVSIDEILLLQQEEKESQLAQEELKKKAMKDRGLLYHHDIMLDDF